MIGRIKAGGGSKIEGIVQDCIATENIIQGSLVQLDDDYTEQFNYTLGTSQTDETLSGSDLYLVKMNEEEFFMCRLEDVEGIGRRVFRKCKVENGQVILGEPVYASGFYFTNFIKGNGNKIFSYYLSYNATNIKMSVIDFETLTYTTQVDVGISYTISSGTHPNSIYLGNYEGNDYLMICYSTYHSNWYSAYAIIKYNATNGFSVVAQQDYLNSEALYTKVIKNREGTIIRVPITYKSSKNGNNNCSLVPWYFNFSTETITQGSSSLGGSYDSNYLISFDYCFGVSIGQNRSDGKLAFNSYYQDSTNTIRSSSTGAISSVGAHYYTPYQITPFVINKRVIGALAYFSYESTTGIYFSLTKLGDYSNASNPNTSIYIANGSSPSYSYMKALVMQGNVYVFLPNYANSTYAGTTIMKVNTTPKVSNAEDNGIYGIANETKSATETIKITIPNTEA